MRPSSARSARADSSRGGSARDGSGAVKKSSLLRLFSSRKGAGGISASAQGELHAMRQLLAEKDAIIAEQAARIATLEAAAAATAAIATAPSLPQPPPPTLTPTAAPSRLAELMAGGAVETAVSALEAAKAAAEGGAEGERRAEAYAAWRMAWDTAWGAAGGSGGALGPLRQARDAEQHPDGAGDAAAAAAADLLLARAALADPPGRTFTARGGVLGRAEIAEGGTVFRTTGEPSNSPWVVKCCHASTRRIGSGRYLLALPVSACTDTGNILIGLSAAQKDLTTDGDVSHDEDVWLMYCEDGSLYAHGGEHANVAGRAILAGEEIALDFDAAAGTLRFLCGEEVLGVHTGVAAEAKIIVTMGAAGNAALLL